MSNSTHTLAKALMWFQASSFSLPQGLGLVTAFHHSHHLLFNFSYTWSLHYTLQFTQSMDPLPARSLTHTQLLCLWISSQLYPVIQDFGTPSQGYYYIMFLLWAKKKNVGLGRRMTSLLLLKEINVWCYCELYNSFFVVIYLIKYLLIISICCLVLRVQQWTSPHLYGASGH